jgi:hypothetical protein
LGLFEAFGVFGPELLEQLITCDDLSDRPGLGPCALEIPGNAFSSTAVSAAAAHTRSCNQAFSLCASVAAYRNPSHPHKHSTLNNKTANCFINAPFSDCKL